VIDFDRIEGFDWDAGNARKNEKHEVTQAEAEQVFFNEPLLLLADEKHSELESRHHAYGRTNEGRLLHITFTPRANGTKLRIISARTMSIRERRLYEKA
jgi:uncharacterized DUF497 family protein